MNTLAFVFSNKVLLTYDKDSSGKGVSMKPKFNKKHIAIYMLQKLICICRILMFSFKIFYSERNYCSNLIIFNFPN